MKSKILSNVKIWKFEKFVIFLEWSSVDFNSDFENLNMWKCEYLKMCESRNLKMWKIAKMWKFYNVKVWICKNIRLI